jgi:hypothetical protein
MKAPFIVALALFTLVVVQPLRAQFSPDFLQNGSYWDDGKAEIDFYDAQVMRDGQLRPCELQMILARATTSLPHPQNPSQAPPPAIRGVRMSQSVTIPLGIVNEKRDSTAFFFPTGALLDAQVATARADGIVFSRAMVLPGAKEMIIEATGPDNKMELPLDSAPTLLRDELPLRVRTLDLSKGNKGEFDFHLVDTQPPWSTRQTGRSSAKLTFRMEARELVVEVREEQGLNSFKVDRDFPFLLREWKTADGCTFRLKNSLKADYQKYTREGDREKAFKDPMLRHPD